MSFYIRQTTTEHNFSQIFDEKKTYFIFGLVKMLGYKTYIDWSIYDSKIKGPTIKF